MNRAELLERHGRAFGELALALVWTDGLEGDDAKRVTRKGWNKAAPLAHADYAGAMRRVGAGEATIAAAFGSRGVSEPHVPLEDGGHDGT